MQTFAENFQQMLCQFSTKMYFTYLIDNRRYQRNYENRTKKTTFHKSKPSKINAVLWIVITSMKTSPVISISIHSSSSKKQAFGALNEILSHCINCRSTPAASFYSRLILSRSLSDVTANLRFLCRTTFDSEHFKESRSWKSWIPSFLAQSSNYLASCFLHCEHANVQTAKGE